MDDRPMPVTHSQLTLEQLADAIKTTYAFDSSVRATLLRSWTNDVYQLAVGDTNYILKVYRASWKRPPDVEWEVQLQHWLHEHGASVASVIPLESGQFFGTLTAPEGVRCFALFSHAGGEKPSAPFSPDLFYQYGQGAALLHHASQGFSNSVQRGARDLRDLLTQSLTEIRPWLQDRPQEWQLVLRTADIVRNRLAPFLQEMDWGVCHGDLSLDNLNVSTHKRPVFYDFDLACYGWRAWDVCNALGYASPELQNAFLRGYREVRPFGHVELAAVPYFVAADAIRMMADEISRWAQWCGTWRVDTWVDDKLEWLSGWAENHLI
jgi:Ser/Thr protein kinase RdoA (MazF antagonist)